MLIQFWEIIEKYFLTKICLILIFIGLILIYTAFSPLGSFDEFTTNNINSLLISLSATSIGIWLTISFVQYFIDKQNEKDEMRKENAIILRYNRVMSILLQNYFRYCFCITTPISERNKYDVVAPNIKFNFCDMRDMYKTTAFTNDNLMEPAIVLFYKSDEKIHRYVQRMIENIPLKYNESLAQVLIKIIEIHLMLDSKDAILGNMNNVSGGKQLSESISESIKSESEDWIKMFDMGQLQNNAMFPYVLLYKKLKAELALFNEYQKCIEQIKHKI